MAAAAAAAAAGGGQAEDLRRLEETVERLERAGREKVSQQSASLSLLSCNVALVRDWLGRYNLLHCALIKAFIIT